MTTAGRCRWPGRLLVAGLLAAGCGGVPAAAQVPAVGCEVADFNIVLKLYIPLAADGSGAAAPGGMQGSLEIYHQKVPKDRRLWSLDGRRPQQFWNLDGELRVQIVLGSGEERVQLVLEAMRRLDSGEHAGTFRLETGPVKVTGRLACVVG